MFKSLNKIVAVAAIAMAGITVASAQAQEVQLKVATGAASGNYSRIFKEFQQACKNEIMQIEVNTGGSNQNLDQLVGNAVNGGYVQTDALFYRARNEDLSGIKTLFSLYPEEVHIITPMVSPIKHGGVAGFGAKPIAINYLDDLANRAIVSYGGSVTTAQLIRLQSEVPYNILEVASFKEARALIDSGDAAALLMVGGQPMADVNSLGRGYKFVSFTENNVSKLKSAYIPAKLNYASMSQTGIQSVATEALFVTQVYKTPKYNKALKSLRECFLKNIDDLKETTGMHPKWKAVKPSVQGKWAYNELN